MPPAKVIVVNHLQQELGPIQKPARLRNVGRGEPIRRRAVIAEIVQVGPHLSDAGTQQRQRIRWSDRTVELRHSFTDKTVGTCLGHGVHVTLMRCDRVGVTGAPGLGDALELPACVTNPAGLRIRVCSQARFVPNFRCRVRTQVADGLGVGAVQARNIAPAFRRVPYRAELLAQLLGFQLGEPLTHLGVNRDSLTDAHLEVSPPDGSDQIQRHARGQIDKGVSAYGRRLQSAHQRGDRARSEQRRPHEPHLLASELARRAFLILPVERLCSLDVAARGSDLRSGHGLTGQRLATAGKEIQPRLELRDLVSQRILLDRMRGSVGFLRDACVLELIRTRLFQCLAEARQSGLCGRER